ncbi:MFS transporter [Kitasatospora cinereorecta]
MRATSTRVAVLAAGALITATTETLWPLIAIAVVEGSLLGLTGPASGVLLVRLAPDEHLGRANSLFSMVLRLAPIAGSPLGAWLVVVGGLPSVMVLAAVGCAVWLVCAAHVTHGMPRPEARTSGPSVLRRSGDGFRLLAAHPRLLWMFVACFCLDLAFAWPAEVALPLQASAKGWGVGTVALVLAAFSVGALASAAAGSALAHRIPVFLKLVVTGTGLAAGMAAMALMPSPLTLAGVACAVGLFSGLNGPALVTAYQQAVPEGRMGAAMSILSLATIGAAPVSLALFSAVSLALFSAVSLHLGVTGTWLLCAALAFLSPLAAAVGLRAPAGKTAHPGRRSPPRPSPPPLPCEADMTATDPRHRPGSPASATPCSPTRSRP